MRIEYLSYPLEAFVPAYGDPRAPLGIETVRSLEHGDSCQVHAFTMQNHWGSHVDAPAHFFGDGVRAAALPASNWYFTSPWVLDLPLQDDQIVRAEDLGDIPPGTDLLLLKSGFSHCRGSERYSRSNPGFSPEAGLFLRQHHPGVRAIGFDFVSLSPFADRELGRAAHRAFLDPQSSGRPILILEDLDLSLELAALQAVLVSPLRIMALDSAPCTVWGFFSDAGGVTCEQ